ncbi:MAG: rhomboid family intramembrane serine protease [Spirochaetaceae bacterium]|jgi:membrane associated rhomboid family serine protease|nr:rhomboid family intramembrane serine protease [Spirochaetaceae bacterium]
MRTLRYSYNNSALILIGINIIVYVLEQIFPRLAFYLALYPVAVMHGWVWQIITYMFVHGNLSHLLFNMLALFVFGVQVERHLGSREFLSYYFSTGIFAGLFSFVIFLLTNHYNVWLMGASGALFAIQLAYAVIFPKAVLYLWGLLPLKAPLMVLGFTALEIVLLLLGLQSGVAHLTHLAGFGFGWLYFLIRLKKNPWLSFRRTS